MPTHEIFTHPPSGGKGIRLFLGYIVPAGIAAYAIIAGLIDADIIIPIKRAGSVEGGSARWLGVTYLSVAAFMHFHYGWGLSEKLWPHSQRGKWISVWACLGSAAMALFSWTHLR